MLFVFLTSCKNHPFDAYYLHKETKVVNLRSYINEIESYIEQNQNDQVIAHSLNILDKYPNYVDALRLLGQAFLETKKYPEAVECFEKVVSIIPDDFVTHVAFSAIKEEERDLDGAIFHMELAFDSQPSNIVVQEELKRLIGKRDGSSPEKINLSRGALVRMYAKGELYQQAINEINAALSTNPQRTDLKIILAEMFVKSNSAVQAAEVCNQVLETLPYCLVPNQILYQIYLDNGLTENSKSVLERLVAVNPYFSWIEPLASSVEDVPDEKIEIEKIDYTSAFSTSIVDNWNIPVIDNLSTDSTLDSLVNVHTTDIPSELMDEILVPGSPFTSEYSDLHSDSSGDNSAQTKDSSVNPLPDFMKQAGWQTSTNPEIGPPADYYDSSEEEPQKTELPDWLKVKASEEFIVNSSISNALNEMAPDVNDLSSDAVPFSLDENNNTRSNVNLPANSEVTMSDDNSPVLDPKDENSDWMAQFFDETKNNQQEPGSEKDLPDWLNNLGQEETDTKPEESLPEWLNTLDSDIVEKNEDTQKSSDLDAILSELASQSQEDSLTPGDITEGTETDDSTLDAEDISTRLDSFTLNKPSFSLDDSPETYSSIESVEQQDMQRKDQDNYSLPSVEAEEDDNQIPDWVKTVLSTPEISDLPSADTESPITESEIFTPETSVSISETETETPVDSVSEGAISASTSEELLGWLKEISPDQGLSDETEVTVEHLQNEFEPSVSESVDEALEQFTVISTSKTDSGDALSDIPYVTQEEEISTAVSPLTEDIEEILADSPISITDESIAELISDSIPQAEVTTDLISENLPSSEIEAQETTPEQFDNSADELAQLVELIKNNQFEDAIHHDLLSSTQENDLERILDALQAIKSERESNFEFMQFLGDVLAKSNRFDEALEVYNRAEELLTRNQE